MTFPCTGTFTITVVRIEILYVPECPHIAPTTVRMREALDVAGVTATVHETPVESDEAALTLGMRGSPTILIDGEDRFASADETGSLSCRLYAVNGLLDGVPSVSQLVEVLTR